MSVKEEMIWAGSEENYKQALSVEKKLIAGMGDMNRMSPSDNEDDCCPRLLCVEDGLATINIKGCLMSSDSPFLAFMGDRASGYPEIREALLAALNDETVQQILLDCDSSGGQVSGCDDTSNLIRTVNKVKPVTAYGDNMLSACYWLACAAGKVYTGKAAAVGSIGIKATFKEYSKQNEMQGVTVTVLRAGKHKALADPNEPLSPEAKAQIMQLLDASYEVFVDRVAEMRKRTYEYADKTMGDGQVFIGQAAVDVGLTDGITTYDAVVGGLKKKIVASSTNTIHNYASNSFSLSGGQPELPGENPMPKKALTEADIAALASGAPVAGGSVLEPEVTTNQTAETDDLTSTQPLDPTNSKGENHGVQEEAGSQVAEEVAKTDPTVQLLISQLAEKDKQLLEAGIKISRLEERASAFETTQVRLLDIAVRSATNMAVALNSVAGVSTSDTPERVLAEHDRLTTAFKAKFVVGGVSAAVGESKEEKVQVLPRHRARVDAVRFQVNKEK